MLTHVLWPLVCSAMAASVSEQDTPPIDAPLFSLVERTPPPHREDHLAVAAQESAVDDATCGDGEADPGEECDFGAANRDGDPYGCTSLCQLPWTAIAAGTYSVSTSGTTEHPVDASSFRVLTAAVTVGQQRRFGAPRAAETEPAVFVSWDQAQRWCAGIGARLPTDAEWDISVGAADAVWEWVSDCWTTDASERERVHHASEILDQDRCAYRGFRGSAAPVGAAALTPRYGFGPEMSIGNLGFRCVLGEETRPVKLPRTFAFVN